MKRILLLTTVFIFFTQCFAIASVGVPDDFELDPDETFIDVTWDANTDDTSYYVLSYGEDEDELDIEIKIKDTDTDSYTITGLKPDTTYYVVLTAYNSAGTVSASTNIEESTTLPSDHSSLPTPTNFDVMRNSDGSIAGLTETSATFEWDAVSDEDLYGYTIYYGINPGSRSNNILLDSTKTQAVITELESGKRYYFTIKSYEKGGEESRASEEIIVDTAPDNLAPETPLQPAVTQSGSKRILITFNSNNENMADLKEYTIYIRNRDNIDIVQPIDIGNITSVNVGDKTDYPEAILSENITYRVMVSAKDFSGNSSAISTHQEIILEKVQNILLDNEDLKSSCFISSLSKNKGNAIYPLLAVMCFIACFFHLPKKMKLFCIVCIFIAMTSIDAHARKKKSKNNIVGVKAGYTLHLDSLYQDTYEDDHPVSGSIYYERILYGGIFTDIEAGFSQLEGQILTESGNPTAIATKLNIFPISASIGYKHFFTDFISAYLGAGPDLWQFSESHSVGTAEEKQNRNIAGYHLKAGVAFLAREVDFYGNIGLQFEVIYSEIDHYGDNDIDLGGVTFQVGYFFKF